MTIKATYIKLHKRSPLAFMCTDKYAVHDYICEKGLEDVLIPVAGEPWDNVEDIDFDCLPYSFVFETTHGCKMNYLVPEKEKLHKNKCVSEMSKWLKTTYGTYSMEPHYLEIPHRIYAEKYIADADNLVDYNFHCMNGVLQLILVCDDRTVTKTRNEVTRHIYDMYWNRIKG